MYRPLGHVVSVGMTVVTSHPQPSSGESSATGASRHVDAGRSPDHVGVKAVAHHLDVDHPARARSVQRHGFTREHAQRCAVANRFQSASQSPAAADSARR